MFFLFLVLVAMTTCVHIEYVNKERIDILANADEYPRITGIKNCNETICVPLHNYTVNERVIHVDMKRCDTIYVSMDMYDAKGELVNATILEEKIPRSNLFIKFIEPGHAMMWLYVLVGLIVVGCLVFLIGHGEDKHKDVDLNEYIFNEN